MTVVDIIIVATSTGGGPPGAIIALVIDIISSVFVVTLSCTSDNSKHGTSVSYYSFDMNGVSPLPMQFKRVETVEGSGDIGRTVYEFTNTADHAIWANNNPNLSGRQRFAPWAYGLLKKVIVYDRSNKKVKETENKYFYDFAKRPLLTEVITFTNTFPPLPIPTTQPLASCKCNVISVSSQRSDDWKKSENINATQTTSDGAMGVDIYPLYTGRTLLIGSVDRVYKKGDDAQWVETETGYYYDNAFEQLQTITKKSSDGVLTGKATICSKQYSGGIIDVMKQNNMLNVPIKTVEYTDGGYFHETVQEYTQIANGDIKLYRTLEERSDRPTLSQDWTHYAGPTSTDYRKYKEIKLLSYDATGNLISVKDEGGRSVASIYDYNDKYIVATVVNADAVTDKPVYTSFETASRGGWQLAASASYDPNGVTGKWSLNLAGNSCTAPINNTSKAYILSFWANNSNVALTSGATLVKSAPVVNGFTYYEYNIAAGTTSVTVSGNALIDELRLYPATARMNTMTYDPLIGKTSECDENNRLTYYEYDDLARLRFIKDENRNIVKMYEYNNVSRPNGCPATYYNPLITQYYTKSNCGPDYIGSDFPYTIPANKYSSAISQQDADAQAEMELMDKGQANADAMPNNSSNCKLVYFNAGKTESFATESCDAGYEGGMVPYTVPARTYSSIVQGEVEQMELDDIAANGQANANDPAHRICTFDNKPAWEWVDGGRTECRTVNSVGHLFSEYKDVNPNSPSYNTTSMQDNGPNSSCPNGPFYSADLSDEYRPTNCPQWWDSYPTYVSMPYGSFTSNISQQDADDKAYNEAIRIANSRNSCVGPPVDVDISINGWNDGSQFETVFTSQLTGQRYYMYNYHEAIPEGAYDVYLNVTNSSHADDYDLNMCGFTAHGSDWLRNIYVSDNNCNWVYIYWHIH
jgi:YD repeat-containing protein